MKKTSIILVTILVLCSCKDPEMDALMEDYCSCLNEHKGDVEGRFECIELMDSIQSKYKHQPRKLQQVLDKTNDCF